MTQPITLFDYQQVSKDWLFAQRKGILADEMGVGKTFPALCAAVLHVRPRLIVAPAYLLTNWEVAIQQLATSLTYVRLDGNKTPEQKYELLKDPKQWDFVLSSYSTIGLGQPNSKPTPKSLPKPAYAFGKTIWNVCICDEAHYLRGRNNQVTQFMYRINFNNLYLLTGTPIQSNGGDLYPLLHLCDPKKYSSYWSFVERYCHLQKDPWQTIVGPVINPEQLHAEVLSKHLLRRKLQDVRSDIPEYVQKPIWIDLTSVTRTKLQIIKKEVVKLVVENGTLQKVPLTSAAAVVHELRRTIAQDAEKLKTVADLVGDYDSTKLIVWCWYKETVVAIQNAIQKRFKKRTVYSITGEHSQTLRSTMAAKFNESKNDVLICTIASMSLGMNLQSSHIAIFYERDYLPSVNTQAIGRQVRVGQTEVVRVYDLVALRSADSTIYTSAQKKADDIDAALAPTKMTYRILSELLLD